MGGSKGVYGWIERERSIAYGWIERERSVAERCLRVVDPPGWGLGLLALGLELDL
jgi:hypothetical protein